MFVCQASCDGQPQLCKGDQECENAQPCTGYVCDTQSLATCGALSPTDARRLSTGSAACARRTK
jgi:hypothetical protein